MTDRSSSCREAVLANLCSCYYSIYLFDLEQNTEEAIWQEDIIREKEFPKGRMDFYYDKFVQNYVCPEDREKMKKAGDKAFLQETLSEKHPSMTLISAGSIRMEQKGALPF